MRRVTILLPVLALAACASDLEKYNVVSGPRLLAIRAEPPTVVPGGSTTLDALVHVDDGEPVEYAWSWCPLLAGTSDAWACALGEDELRARLTALGLTLDVGYDLGRGTTATLPYPAASAAFAALCTTPPETLPADVSPPSCEYGFPLAVVLSLRVGGHETRAFKIVHLALDAVTELNQNPTISGLAYAPKGSPAAEAVGVGEADEPDLHAGDSYDLYAEIPETSAETFTRPFDANGGGPQVVKEGLVLTWFVEAGSTRSMRTSFIDGELGFPALDHNVWELPRPADLHTSASHVVLVVRDERGGVAWLTRSFALTAP
jgi:hypothetical protein